MAALFAGGASASGQVPPQLHIRWTSATCQRSDDFDRELTRLLGDKADEVESSEVEVDIEAAAMEEGSPYQLRLQLAVAAGKSERTLSLTTCNEARHAAALLIGTALEQAQTIRAAVPDEPRATVAQAWHLQLGLLGDLGTLPALSGGPHVLVGWERAGLGLRGGAHYLFAREVGDDDSQLVASIDQLVGSLGVAYVWPLGPLRVGPTVDAELGALRARARGEQGRANKSLRWGAALLGLSAEVPTSERLTFAVSLQVSVPVSRPNFALIGEEPFYDTAPIGFRAGLGVRFSFGLKNRAELGQ